MNEEIKKALELIKNECDNHYDCNNCPLAYEDQNIYHCMFNDLPCEWDLIKGDEK